MDSIKLEKILKYLSAILSAVFILGIALPFVSCDMSTSVAGVSADSSSAINGFNVVTGGGLWGILLVVAPAIIIAACFVPQLENYKKIINLACSGVMILSLFLSAGVVAAASTGASAGAGAGGVSLDISVKHLLGFWIMLVMAILLVGLSIIQFFNLSGNKVFDAVNMNNSEETNGANMPSLNFDKDKLVQSAKNLAGTVADKASNLTQNLSANTAQNTAENIAANPAVVNSEPVRTRQSQPKPMQKENPDVILAQITKMFDMKQAGILTEEEFSDKKQELLKKM